MTKKEMILFMDAWATLVLEHPIVGGWFMEILNRKADRKTEPSKECKMCKHYEDITAWYSKTCEGCYNGSHYEPKDEPQTERSE